MKETIGARHSEAMQCLFLPFNGRSSIFKMWKGNQKCREKVLKREREKEKLNLLLGKGLVSSFAVCAVGPCCSY